MRTGLILKKAIVLKIITSVSFLLFITIIYGQQQSAGFPPAYNALTTDTARMRFLEISISDSLDAGQLTPVLGWARLGLQMAEKNKVDTMKGIFLYDIGKAFTYQYNQFDSAIYYYKQVPPFFPDKMRKYNVISIR